MSAILKIISILFLLNSFADTNIIIENEGELIAEANKIKANTAASSLIKSRTNLMYAVISRDLYQGSVFKCFKRDMLSVKILLIIGYCVSAKKDMKIDEVTADFDYTTQNVKMIYKEQLGINLEFVYRFLKKGEFPSISTKESCQYYECDLNRIIFEMKILNIQEKFYKNYTFTVFVTGCKKTSIESGIASIGMFCDPRSNAVVQNSRALTLILTHELAHLFGAPHLGKIDGKNVFLYNVMNAVAHRIDNQYIKFTSSSITSICSGIKKYNYLHKDSKCLRNFVTNGYKPDTDGGIKPNVTNPNITNPNITNPNITNPNITNPNITNPNITNPNITNPTEDKNKNLKGKTWIYIVAFSSLGAILIMASGFVIYKFCCKKDEDDIEKAAVVDEKVVESD